MFTISWFFQFNKKKNRKLRIYTISLFFALFLYNPVFAGNTNIDGFDFPVGKPDGANYTNGSIPGGNDGWGFVEWNGSVWHPGEDWNRKGAGQKDFGDPIYAIADGVVVTTKNYGGNWGKIILIKHEAPNGVIYWSQYAHLSEILIKENDVVARGLQIGTMGDANGRWASHLHFEIRNKNLSAQNWTGGWSIEKVKENYLEPTVFINSNRSISAVQLNAPTNITSTTLDLSWSKNNDGNFAEYRVFRSGSSGSYLGEPIKKITNRDELSFTDTGLTPETPYFYKIQTVNASGFTADSNEVSTQTDSGVSVAVNISNDSLHDDVNPVATKSFVIWSKKPATNEKKNTELWLYDIKNKKSEMATSPIGSWEKPEAWEGNGVLRIVWASGEKGGGVHLYERNTATNQATTRKISSGLMFYPSIYDNTLAYTADRIKKDGSTGGDGVPEVYVYDLSSDQETQIRNPMGALISPETGRDPGYYLQVFGNFVVWREWIFKNNQASYFGFDVVAYKIQEKTTTLIKHYDMSQTEDVQIDLSNNLWTVFKPNSLKEVLVYDLLTGEQKFSSTNNEFMLPKHNLPATLRTIILDANRIIYLTNENKIKLFDMEKKEHKTLIDSQTSTLTRGYLGAKDENLTYQEKEVSGKNDVFYYKIKN